MDKNETFQSQVIEVPDCDSCLFEPESMEGPHCSICDGGQYRKADNARAESVDVLKKVRKRY